MVDPFFVARPSGFEPPTPGFGGLYSIQLSYGRRVMDYLMKLMASNIHVRHPARRPASRSRLLSRRSPFGFGGRYSNSLVVRTWS